jgi:hypothetical protein
MSDESKTERERLCNYTDEDRRRDMARLLDAPLPPHSEEDSEHNGIVLMQREFRSAMT